MKDTRYLKRKGFLSHVFAFMAEMATYIGIEPRTIVADPANADIGRGLRVFLQANGYVALQDNTALGDYMTITAITHGLAGEGASLFGGGKVPAVASEAVNAGDQAYTAANGQCGKTSTSNVAIGKWTQPASGAGVLSEIELKA
jgi:hypothetical protein